MDAIVRIARLLREKGSATPEELMSGISRRTFYRAVSVLRDAEVVVLEGGVYQWYDSTAKSVYRNAFEAKLALDHSTRIVTALQSLIAGVFAYSAEKDLLPRVEYSEDALAHLRTGYRRLYEDYGKASNMKREISEGESEFREDVRARLIGALPELSSGGVVADNILRDVKEALRGHDPSFLLNLRVEGDEVRSNPHFLGRKELAEPLRRFISEEEQSTVNRESCGKIVALENEYYVLMRRLEKDAATLLKQVENGTPLKGSCPMCPKARIG
ncbi:hypothetical protein MUP00_05685 [Candidatus Bathyarchaeota archaeon]|nr:hypothetical protein [Candidatus Bathyarchaeota archaeon]